LFLCVVELPVASTLWGRKLFCVDIVVCVYPSLQSAVLISATKVFCFLKCFNKMGGVLKVESVEAVKNIPEIAAVEGVDCIQMGPLDLRADMGLLGFPTDSRPSNLLR
jgi:citrate lyase beta subunit